MKVTGLIFAGGQSRRMGQDKAQMYGGVERLCSVLSQAGVEEVVVLAGTQERADGFAQDAVADPEGADGLHDVIRWARRRLKGTLLLVPCDAFLLDAKAVKFLLQHVESGGVPLDEEGHRQPLFSIITAETVLPEKANSVSALLSALPSVPSGMHAKAFTNFNTPDEVERHRLEHRRGQA